MQPYRKFIIPMFLNCSTCFERHNTHHKELKNCNCSLWFYIRLWLSWLSGNHSAMTTTNVRKTRGCSYSFWAPDNEWCVSRIT